MPRVFYVYCVGSRAEVAPHVAGAPGAIEEGAGVEAVGGGELAAVVSAVPAEDYGEKSFESRLMSDAEWTAARAMRHERVVGHFAARATIVPLRFGTIYLRRERVERML
ncbi:MAG TPA: GvpL/GvpF family gas vesicle protein, partial [Pyrinomonadaceae bacterium]|nr:GvpL/GvpF family gas vesicle protein [Pyrinomonadaceae bacterium]